MSSKIKTIHEDTLEIEIAPDVVVRQVRSMILSVPAKPEPEIKKPAAKKAPAKRTAAKKPSETAKAPAKRASKAKSDDA